MATFAPPPPGFSRNSAHLRAGVFDSPLSTKGSKEGVKNCLQVRCGRIPEGAGFVSNLMITFWEIVRGQEREKREEEAKRVSPSLAFHLVKNRGQNRLSSIRSPASGRPEAYVGLHGRPRSPNIPKNGLYLPFSAFPETKPGSTMGKGSRRLRKRNLRIIRLF